MFIWNFRLKVKSFVNGFVFKLILSYTQLKYLEL